MVVAESKSWREAARFKWLWSNLNPGETKRPWPNLNPKREVF